MTNALDPGLSSAGLIPRRGPCVVFLGTQCLFSTNEFNAKGNPVMDYHPIQGEVEIVPVAEIGDKRP